jgi:hypothetical protein
MVKDFDREGWMKGNKNDFEELVRRAREKGSSARKAETENETSEATEPSSEAQQGSQQRKSVQEIFRSAGSSSQGLPSSEGEAGERTAKSPFFDTNGTAEPQAEESGRANS